MGYKAEGKIEKIFDTEQKTDSFRAREFVIEVEDGQYPQMVKFQLVQDKCEIVDSYSEGDQIEVEFDLRGRQWNDKYFTNLQAWRISKAGENSASEGSGGTSNMSAPTSSSSNTASAPASAPAAVNSDFDDDIPF